MLPAPVMKDFVDNFARRKAARKIALVEALVEMMESASVRRAMRVDSASARLAQITVMEGDTALPVHAFAELDGRVLGARLGAAPTIAAAWVSAKPEFVHASTGTLVKIALWSHVLGG